MSEGRNFFELTTSPNLLWADLSQFNLQPGAPVMALDADDIALFGDVSSQLRPAKAPF